MDLLGGNGFSERNMSEEMSDRSTVSTLALG